MEYKGYADGTSRGGEGMWPPSRVLGVTGGGVALGACTAARRMPKAARRTAHGVFSRRPGRAISLRRFADGDSRREKNRQKWRILPQPQSLGGNAERAELDNDGARLRKRAMFKSHRAFLSHQRRRRPQQSRINRRWTTWPAPTFHYVREVAVMGGRKPSPCCAPEREA